MSRSSVGSVFGIAFVTTPVRNGSLTTLRVPVLLTLLLTTIACGGPPSSDPVAAVSVRTDRSTVSIGSPLELSIQFLVSRTLETIDQNYRVMVHFLDDQGEMMWAADHAPTTPTTEWQPGQTIEYTQRIRVPMYPYVGQAVVAVGLYSATTGSRLTLSGDHISGNALTAPPPSRFNFSTRAAGYCMKTGGTARKG